MSNVIIPESLRGEWQAYKDWHIAAGKKPENREMRGRDWKITETVLFAPCASVSEIASSLRESGILISEYGIREAVDVCSRVIASSTPKLKNGVAEAICSKIRALPAEAQLSQGQEEPLFKHIYAETLYTLYEGYAEAYARSYIRDRWSNSVLREIPEVMDRAKDVLIKTANQAGTLPPEFSFKQSLFLKMRSAVRDPLRSEQTRLNWGVSSRRKSLSEDFARGQYGDGGGAFSLETTLKEATEGIQAQLELEEHCNSLKEGLFRLLKPKQQELFTVYYDNFLSGEYQSQRDIGRSLGKTGRAVGLAIDAIKEKIDHVKTGKGEAIDEEDKALLRGILSSRERGTGRG